jgi:hypothetical protein
VFFSGGVHLGDTPPSHPLACVCGGGGVWLCPGVEGPRQGVPAMAAPQQFCQGGRQHCMHSDENCWVSQGVQRPRVCTRCVCMYVLRHLSHPRIHIAFVFLAGKVVPGSPPPLPFSCLEYEGSNVLSVPGGSGSTWQSPALGMPAPIRVRHLPDVTSQDTSASCCWRVRQHLAVSLPSSCHKRTGRTCVHGCFEKGGWCSLTS